jgi:hypothetical protein
MYIGITTFKERFDSHFKLLLEDIKGYPTIVAVNASYKNGLCNEYRKEMLSLLSHYDNVSPIFYQEMRGCSKMWNDLVLHSPTPHILITNDDNRILNCDQLLKNCKEVTKTYQFFKINNCLSHYVVGKEIMIQMNWFDERFLGFGEEDGDIMWRYLKFFNTALPNHNDSNIQNNCSDIIDQGIQTYWNKYTKFNRVFCKEIENEYGITCKYVHDPKGIQSTYEHPMRQQAEEYMQYPYENFYLKYKKCL